MKKLLLSLVLLFEFSLFSHSQTLSSEFVYGDEELDSFVVDNFVRPYACIKYDMGFDIWTNIIVDSLGNISSVVIMDIKAAHNNWSDKFKLAKDTLIPQLKIEAKRVIKATEGFWIPREVEGKKTWETIEYRIEVRVPEYYTMAEMGYGSYMNRYIAQPDLAADNPIKYYNLGVKKLNQKKYYIAIKYFQKSINFGNRTKDVFYNLGIANFFYGLKEEACKSWQQAAKIGDEEAQNLINENCR